MRGVIITLLALISAAPAAADLMGSSVRGDYVTDQKLYPETCCANKGGGRVSLVLSATGGYAFNGTRAGSYPLTVVIAGDNDVASTVELKGDGDASFSDSSGGLDWCHADVDGATARVWVSFHAHDDDYITGVRSVNVTDGSGALLASASGVGLSSSPPDLRVSYVTSMDGFKTLVVHVHNYDGDDEEGGGGSGGGGGNSHTISSLSVDGVDIPAAAGVGVPAGGHRVFTAAALDGRQEGSVWTALLGSDESEESFGAGGRLVKENFILEDWPKSDQCPFFGADEDNRAQLASELHLNSRFLQHGGTCDADAGDVLKATAAARAADGSGELLLLQQDLSDPDSSHFLDDGVIEDSAFAVAALSLGDEVDKGYGDDVTDVWRAAVARRLAYPGLSTFQGGHVASFNGAYAGMADVQGMDFYVAACAPHVTNYLSTMRIQGAYDYIRTAVLNQAPLPTWGYAQGYSPGTWQTDLDSGELTVQLASVVAAGAKGVMLFQSDLSCSDEGGWTSGGKLMRMIAAVGDDFLRTADHAGPQAVVEKDDGDAGSDASLVGVLVGPTAIVVVAASTNCDSYDDVTCSVGVSNHWQFHEHTIERLEVSLPEDWRGVSLQIKEVSHDGDMEDPDVDEAKVGDDSLSLEGIAFDGSGTHVLARIFVVTKEE